MVYSSRRVSPWHDLEQDTARPTVFGVRELLARYDQLNNLARHDDLLKPIPLVKVGQWALEGNGLDAASMADLAAPKRYAVALAVIRRRCAQVIDDLCEIFCKQMSLVAHAAEEALQQYLTENQAKTDEIVRRFAALEVVLKSNAPAAAQLLAVQQNVTGCPDLCEFSRLHTEYGGKNECRFMAKFFKNRRSELLHILTRLTFVSTSQDMSFERSLALMLAQRDRRAEWIELSRPGAKAGAPTALNLQDLAWVSEKWWRLVTGEGSSPRQAPARLQRRQFEVCVCMQMVRELKSGDLCVVGADTYSDCRDEFNIEKLCRWPSARARAPPTARKWVCRWRAKRSSSMFADCSPMPPQRRTTPMRPIRSSRLSTAGPGSAVTQSGRRPTASRRSMKPSSASSTP